MIACITHIMSNPEGGFCPVGYLECNADEVIREKAKADQKEHISKEEVVV